MYHISPRYIREEEEVRTGRTLDRIIIGEGIGCLVEKEINNSNRGYGQGRGYFRRGSFQGRNSGNFRGNNSRDRNREDRRPWTQSRSRERGVRARSESSSRSRSNLRVSINRDRVRCFKCREYDHFANECPNLVLEDLDRESDSARQASLQILADSDTGSEVEQYLNI